jgi:hypothetical protein
MIRVGYLAWKEFSQPGATPHPKPQRRDGVRFLEARP